MMALVDRALVLNPNFARAWHISALLRNWAGQPDIAIEHAEASRRLSPRARIGASLLAIGAAHFFSRRFDEAVPKLLLPIHQDPGFSLPYYWLTACYAHMGLFEEARGMIARLRAIMPEVMVNLPLPYRNPQHRELFLSGLRLAMGETT